MKSYQFYFFLLLLVLLGCQGASKKEGKVSKPMEQEAQVQQVAEIQGQQLTGVAIYKKRLFVNFPRWRENVTHSVSEIVSNNEFVPYPNQRWNSWQLGNPVNDSVFVAVQSVVALNGLLYVIDTRNPEFKGVIGQPIIFVFDLTTNQLVERYKLPETAFHSNSYINDLRIDLKRKYAYFTDSGNPGLVLLNLENGATKRVLEGHVSTTSEMDVLTINNKEWKNTVHSDGIAFDPTTGMLYYHALTAYNLYAISVDILINETPQNIEQSVQLVKKTAAPDGMIVHKEVLYYADLENHKIMQLNLTTNTVTVLVEGDAIKWADSFAIEEDYLYYTNSRIHEAQAGVSDLVFSVNRVKL